RLNGKLRQQSPPRRARLGHRLPRVRRRPQLRRREPGPDPASRPAVPGQGFSRRPAGHGARCLKGLPHPSGTNGWRVRLYTAQRRALASQIARWAASALPGRRGDDPVPGLSAAPPPSSLPEPAPGAAPQPGNIPASDRPRIAIRLTAGNLNHGYVSLARHLDLFPAAAIGPASSKDGTGTLLTLRFAGIPGITQAPLTPAIPGHTAHSRAEDNPSPPAENSARTQRSLSPAIQQHDPGRQRGVLPMTSGRSFTCCLLRRAKESVSRDWTRTPLRARITGPLVTYATPGTGQRQRSGWTKR